MILNSFSKFFVSIKSLLYLIFKISFFSKNKKNIVYFNLTHSKYWRTYFNIIYSYLNAGYIVKIKFNFKFLAGSDQNSFYLFTNKNCSITFKNLMLDKYLLCITDSYFLSKLDNSNIIYLNPVNLESIPIHNLSYFMHPFQYTSGLIESIYSLRLKNKRNFKIFFSGNTSQESYNSSLINKRFCIKNRIELLNLIYCDTLIPYKLEFSKSLDHSSLQNKIVVNSWEWSHSKSFNLNNRVDSDKWLLTLADSSFFICCPGLIMPFSHNAIEAMSVRCIPVLEYSHLFTPPLLNNINCISFNGENLIEILVNLINMDEVFIENMRKEVIKYYDDFLSPKAMVNKVNSCINKNINFIDETTEWSRV